MSKSQSQNSYLLFVSPSGEITPISLLDQSYSEKFRKRNHGCNYQHSRIGCLTCVVASSFEEAIEKAKGERSDIH